jgi:hypothetical protein
MGDGFSDDEDGDGDQPDGFDDFDDDEFDRYDDEGDDDQDHTGGPVPKPAELLALDSVTAELFDTLRRWFDVPAIVSLDLTEVDSAVAELGDPQMVAALAMRKLQALNLLATPGVRTTTDVVVAIVNDLERAMVQAPNMWLKRQAAATDWDRAFAAMESGDVDGLDEAPVEADEVDPEVERFRTLHSALHDAMFAVIEISRGAIREFE